MTREEIQARVRAVLVETFELEESQVVPQANLYGDLDLDSLDAIDLAIKLKAETGLALGEEEVKSIRTIDDIINVIERNLNCPPAG